MGIWLDRSSRTPPGLTLALLSSGHAAIHALSALLPLVYAIVIVEFGLDERDIGTFIAITTAVGGTMQLAYGVLTRYVARPALLAGGQLVFGLAPAGRRAVPIHRSAAGSDQRHPHRRQPAAPGRQRAPLRHLPGRAPRLRDQHAHRRRQRRHRARAVRRRRAARDDRLAGDAGRLRHPGARHRRAHRAPRARGPRQLPRGGASLGIGPRAPARGSRPARPATHHRRLAGGGRRPRARHRRAVHGALPVRSARVRRGHRDPPLRAAPGRRRGRTDPGRHPLRPLRAAADARRLLPPLGGRHRRLRRGRREPRAARAAAAAIRHRRLQRVAGAPGLPGRSRLRADPRRRVRRLLHVRVRHRRRLGVRHRFGHR